MAKKEKRGDPLRMGATAMDEQKSSKGQLQTTQVTNQTHKEHKFSGTMDCCGRSGGLAPSS